MENFVEIQERNDANSLKKSLYSLFERLDVEKSDKLLKDSKKLHETLLKNKTKFYELISSNLSLMGLLEYRTSPDNYKNAINMLEDARFLAENSRSNPALKMNHYCSALVLSEEKNYEEALIRLEKAQILRTEDKFFEDKINAFADKIYTLKNTLRNTFGSNMSGETMQKTPMVALLNVARTLAVETSLDMLLITVAQEVKQVLNADRCSVFLYDKEKNELWSKVAQGLDSEEIRFSADEGIAGYVAKTGEIVNIDDAYEDARFNKNVDIMTGYKTNTMLCMPMKNMKHEILGVFQVLNKKDGYFTKEDEELLVAIGSSSGIAIENARLFDFQQRMINSQTQQFESFIDTLAASIDARDKITAGHSGRVKMYSKLICENMRLDKSERNNIIHAAILHDIGKIGIRDSVLQKDGKLTDEEFQHIQQHVKITYDILNKIYLSDRFNEVAEIASSHHEKYDGTGYFRKLAGDNICLGGRILAVADVFDAITSKRHYRDKMPIRDALGIISGGAGKHFDPKITEAFFNIRLDKLVNVFLSEVDWCLPSDDEVLLSKYNIKYLYGLITTKEIESFDGEEKKFFDTFNHYYNCKSGN